MGLFSTKKKDTEEPDVLERGEAKENKFSDVTASIRTAVSLNDLLIGTANKAKEIIPADRITIYAVESENNLLVSRVMDGDEVKAIEVPVKNSSIAGYVANNGKEVNIVDAYNEVELQNNHFELKFDKTWDEKTGYRTRQVLCSPITFQGSTHGVIQCINKKDKSETKFTSDDMTNLKRLAEALAPDLYKIKAFEESQKQLEIQKRIRNIIDKIHSASDTDDMFSNITQDLKALFNIESISIYLNNKESNELVAKYRISDEFEEIHLPVDSTSIAGYVAGKNEILNINDVYNTKELNTISTELKFNDEWDKKYNLKTRNILAAPITYSNEVIGVIQLINKKNGARFLDKDKEMIKELSLSIGIASSKSKRTKGKRSKYNSLIALGLVDEEQLEKAKEMSKEKGDSIDDILISEYGVPKDKMLQAYATFFRTKAVQFNPDMQIPVDLIKNLEFELLKSELWVPLEKTETGKLRVVMEDPKDIIKRDLIQRRMKVMDAEFCLGIRSDIINIIDYFFGVDDEEIGEPEDVNELLSELEEEMGGNGLEDDILELKENDSAIVKLVNQIIEQAYVKGVSDIHIEPYTETDTIVRYRIDGACQEVMKIPRHYKNALISRIKIMCNLDISERRLPQDGKIKFRNFGKLDIELRVATIPTVGGNEDVVLRILASSKPMPLNKMGMNERNYNEFIDIIQKPYGLVLVVGPTGSGKTTTLHSALGHINVPERKIWTAEDPVEIQQYQLRQVQVQGKIGYNFARAMRAFLRGDPDVIMVGEMRDHETTAMGVEAALTGHLVFSTLHTNSAPETVTRLLDMGIDPFSFADALLGVLAQRLVKTLCSCKEEKPLEKAEYDLLRAEYGDDKLFDSKYQYSEGMTIYKPKPNGCGKCNGSGMKGRMGIHELLLGSPEVQSMIHKKPKVQDLHNLAVSQGMITLKQDGLEKVLSGHTTLNAVLAVCMK